MSVCAWESYEKNQIADQCNFQCEFRDQFLRPIDLGFQNMLKEECDKTQQGEDWPCSCKVRVAVWKFAFMSGKAKHVKWRWTGRSMNRAKLYSSADTFFAVSVLPTEAFVPRLRERKEFFGDSLRELDFLDRRPPIIKSPSSSLSLSSSSPLSSASNDVGSPRRTVSWLSASGSSRWSSSSGKPLAGSLFKAGGVMESVDSRTEF